MKRMKRVMEVRKARRKVRNSGVGMTLLLIVYFEPIQGK